MAQSRKNVWKMWNRFHCNEEHREPKKNYKKLRRWNALSEPCTCRDDTNCAR